MEEPIIIAELCCNHMGNLDLAKKMILSAKQNGADIVKFQKRDIGEWVEHKPEVYKKPHPNPDNSFGDTYENHRRFLEFDYHQHKILKEYCDSLGIEYSSSVWDIKSAKEIIQLNPKMIKIASACNQKFELLDYLCENYQGEIHISTGMTLYEDIDEIVDYFIKRNRAKDLVIYICTSSYPVKPQDICLLEITRLIEKYKNIVKCFGFSGHHNGTNIDIAAFTLGARYIERHFTLNKNFKGTDQKASLEPNELRDLRSKLNEVYLALAYKDNKILDVENSNKEKLKW